MPKDLSKREKRTPELLQKASDHLHYEIWMLRTLARALASRKSGQGAINNALLESFTIHARILLDFLYADKPWPDDVIAEDFFDRPERWHVARPPKSEELKTLDRRVGKEIAHLTYARQDVTPETKGWRFIEIAEAVNEAINQFLESVSQESLGSRWKR